MTNSGSSGPEIHLLAYGNLFWFVVIGEAAQDVTVIHLGSFVLEKGA